MKTGIIRSEVIVGAGGAIGGVTEVTGAAGPVGKVLGGDADVIAGLGVSVGAGFVLGGRRSVVLLIMTPSRTKRLIIQ